MTTSSAVSATTDTGTSGTVIVPMASPSLLEPERARPLTPREISQVLDGIADSARQSSGPSHLVKDAVGATVTALREWCAPADVDRALACAAR